MMFWGWLGAFLFTQAVEVPIYTGAMRGRPAVAFLASAITHPFVWFVFPPISVALGLGYWRGVLLSEVFAIGVEAIFLQRMGLRRSLRWSVLANVASVGLGFLSRWTFGWP